ncbi:MAG TPA: hypothetical protein VK871_01080 [Candidatus Limnocylindrales bacterium]|nr:hypothetical protein [Candidatus Limnocylindrales bacterium]
MTDPIEQVLRLVADGRLTAEEAGPVLDALQAAREAPGEDDEAARDDEAASTGRPARAVRIEVSEGGRKVVNLRVPLSLGRMALDRVPGLSFDTIGRIREALEQGLTGPIVTVDEDGDGVRIVLE